MFENAFNSIDNALRKDAGCSTELDYIEQTSWILFLKYLHDYEADKKTAARANGTNYTPLISKEFHWQQWAAPKKENGELNYNIALSGDDLKNFVDEKLFPYLKKFKEKAQHTNTLEYKIGEIFNELKNKLHSGHSLREIINHIDELRFRRHQEKHEMSNLYEDKIKRMGNAGRNGGEYYTPRPLIKSIVKIINPKIGEKVYDGAVGSAGFLCEAYDYMQNNESTTIKKNKTLQENTFYGKEKKSLAYIIGIMNMILHGVDAPNIIHTNTLAENISDIQEKDRINVILANPPFGGKERPEIQQNFPIRTSETAYLFLQHFIKMLKANGRAGVVIKNTFLSNTDNASIALRKQLLEECNLHTVLDLPSGVFLGTGVKTVVLFFQKGEPTKNIWYYQLNPDRNLGKTNPLNENDLAEFIAHYPKQKETQNSWRINITNINTDTYDLTVHNPNRPDITDDRTPEDIIDQIETLDAQITKSLHKIKDLL